MNKAPQTLQGWAVPPGCREAHYFISSKALCGTQDYSGAVEDTKHDHPDNCFTCMRLRLERETAGGAK